MMIRRAAALIISAMSVASSSGSSVDVQLLAAFIVYAVFLGLHLYVQPYQDAYLNTLDSIALNSILSSILVGGLYQSRTISIGSSNLVALLFVFSLMGVFLVLLWFVIAEVTTNVPLFHRLRHRQVWTLGVQYLRDEVSIGFKEQLSAMRQCPPRLGCLFVRKDNTRPRNLSLHRVINSNALHSFFRTSIRTNVFMWNSALFPGLGGSENYDIVNPERLQETLAWIRQPRTMEYQGRQRVIVSQL